MTETKSDKIAKKLDPNGINDRRVMISEFLGAIEIAKSEGEEWVETSKEVIAHYNRKGLGPSNFFVYGGVKVCEEGNREAAEKELDRDLAQELHGRNEGRNSVDDAHKAPTGAA